MAEFNIEIDRIRGQATYAPQPTLDSGSLGVIVKKSTQDFTDSGITTAPRYSSNTVQVPGGAFITGPEFASSTRWFVFWSGTMGASNDDTIPWVSLVDSVATLTDRVWGFASAEGPYLEGSTGTTTQVPISGHNVGGGGPILYIPNGTTLEFRFQNKIADGHPCTYHDFQIIAIPADGFEQLVDFTYAISPNGNDNGPSAYYSLPTNSAVSYETALSKGLGARTDDYLLIASGVANESGAASGAQHEFIFFDNVSADPSITNPWKKQGADSRDLLPFNMASIRPYTQNQIVTVTLQGKPSTATISRFVYYPRIFIWRLGSLARKRYQLTSFVDVPVTSIYGGAWQTVAEVLFTPIAETGEYALVMGRMGVRRAEFGAMLGRLRIKETGEIIKDFVCTTNVDNTGYDHADIFMVTAKLVNTPYTYQLQVIQGEGSTGTGYVEESMLLVAGMTIGGAAPNTYNIGIDDAAATNSASTFSSTGGTGGNVYGEVIPDTTSPAQNAVSVLDASLVVTPVATTPALVHPRLWLYNNDRLAYLRTRTGGAEYTRWQTALTGLDEDQSSPWQYILKWKTTLAPAALATAVSKYFGAGGLFSRSMISLLWGSDLSNSGFNYRFVMRNLALALDWFYDDNGVDVLTVANGAPANARAQIRNAILALTYAKCNSRATGYALEPLMNPVNGGPNSYLDWANTDTHNNHFYFMMMGANYAGIVLYGEQPTTFTYQSGPASGWINGTSHSFTIPFHIYSGNPANYTQIWDWVQARVTDLMLPNLDTDWAGGFGEEGTNYGLSASLYMVEMFALLKTAAGQNHIDTHPVFADHGYFQLYQTQPGITNNVNLGDQPNAPVGRALVVDRNRLLALHVADALPALPIAGYLQYWLNHKRTFMDEGTFEPLDFLLYRDTRPETDLVGLPTHYVADGTGFWNSRDTWADTGVSVSMSACDHGEEHHHSDFGAIQIYRGDSPNPGDAGFLIIDLNMKSGTGDNWDLHNHSTHTFCTASNPNGWPQQGYDVPPLVPPPPVTAPPIPVLSSPANAATAIADPCTLAWLTSTGATSYTVQVSTSLAFGVLAFSATGVTSLSSIVAGLSGSTVHYWRVSATNSGGTSGYSAVFSFTTATGTTPPPPAGVKLVEDTSLMQIFPVNNWWNMDVSAWPLHASSNAIITELFNYGALHGDKVSGFHPDWGTVASTYGIPYIGVDGTQALVPLTFDGTPSESDYGIAGQPAGYPIPSQAHTSSGTTPGYREENGDNHMLVFDRQNMRLYELYKARWTGSSWLASNGACFNMNSNARRPNGWTSTDAAGLAVFPGLVKYDDMFSGNVIRHSTRFSTSLCPATYYYPASHSGSADAPPSWPLGMRMRLKASFNIATFVAGFTSLSVAKRDAMARLMQSWKTYGCIQADRGSHGFFQGTMDNRWVDGEYNQLLRALKWTDFEILQYGYVGP